MKPIFSEPKKLNSVNKRLKINNFLKTENKEEVMKHIINNKVIELPREYNGPFSINNYIQDDLVDDKFASLLKNNFT